MVALHGGIGQGDKGGFVGAFGQTANRFFGKIGLMLGLRGGVGERAGVLDGGNDFAHEARILRGNGAANELSRGGIAALHGDNER